MKTFLLTVILLSQTIFANKIDKKEKLIMIFTKMHYCQWCNKMQKETFDNPKALEQLKKYYLITTIYRESGDLPTYLHPTLFPTTYILSPDGMHLIEEIEGYMSKDKFLKYTKNLYEIEMEDDLDLKD